MLASIDQFDVLYEEQEHRAIDGDNRSSVCHGCSVSA
jgi:hypothetical protein